MNAQEMLTEMLGGDVEPTLGTEVVAQLVSDSQARDSEGRWTTDTGYVDTYDLNRAAARGWRMKAGRVAANFNFTVEGRQVDRADVVKNFLAMAKEYARLANVRSARLSGERESLWLTPWMNDSGGDA